jgi:hypothetical protein
VSFFLELQFVISQQYFYCVEAIYANETVVHISCCEFRRIFPDHVRNEEMLLRVSEQRNILHEIRKRKANWIGYILRRICLLRQVIEGKIQGQM